MEFLINIIKSNLILSNFIFGNANIQETVILSNKVDENYYIVNDFKVLENVYTDIHLSENSDEKELNFELEKKNITLNISEIGSINEMQLVYIKKGLGTTYLFKYRENYTIFVNEYETTFRFSISVEVDSPKTRILIPNFLYNATIQKMGEGFSEIEIISLDEHIKFLDSTYLFWNKSYFLNEKIDQNSKDSEFTDNKNTFSVNIDEKLYAIIIPEEFISSDFLNRFENCIPINIRIMLSEKYDPKLKVYFCKFLEML